VISQPRPVRAGERHVLVVVKNRQGCHPASLFAVVRQPATTYT
jgi:hypothetical protein